MATAGDLTSAFGRARLARPLWPHQRRALAAFDVDRRAGESSTYVVIPPGGGKTLVGLEAARRLGRPTVVLCPNTAIQAQWIAQWEQSFDPDHVAATADRELPTALTVLTYQAVCTLDSGGANGDRGANGDLGDNGAGSDDSDRGDRGDRRVGGDAGGPADHGGSRLLDLLHPNGRALVERMHAGGPLTLVLDECHHLLEVWGRLLHALVARLDRPYVIGLTATPPHLMTAGQAKLHGSLFGRVDLEVSAPGLVRDGRLAPYQELVHLARPDPAEADYIHGEALRFAELRTDLLAPDFAGTPFLAWLEERVVRREGRDGGRLSWQRFERDEPALADAAVRLHTAGLLPLPEGARVREQHRHPPGAQDWVALIGDYARRCLRAGDDPRDERAYEALRRALPAVGYRLTRAGPRAGQSPVDRVLARSASKARAAAEILEAESAELGDRLRALVLCDFEEAGGTPPARLAGVLDAQAGGARLVLETLIGGPAAGLDPVLLTGGRVAAAEPVARRLAGWLADAEPDLEPVVTVPAERAGWAEVTGSSRFVPRRYVPLVTRFFTGGGSRCLVGTRALLGEGWDAPAVNVVVDLTAATTPTSVVQNRGRALRLNPHWPDKVADNWSVVCVTGEHPKGAADYERFVRKHDRYFALAPTGDIVSGVAHVDPTLSPYAPPPEAEFDARNAAMLSRVADRPAVRERWRIGEPYEDEPVVTVSVTTGRSLGVAGRVTVPMERTGRAARRGTAAVLAGLVPALAVLAGLTGGRGTVLGAVLIVGAVLVAAVAAARRTAGRLAASASGTGLEDIALATADALHAAGLTGRGGDAVRVEPLADGSYRAHLAGVPAGESDLYATALDEVLSPLGQPRYVVPRLVVDLPPGRLPAFRAALRRLAVGHLPATVVYHAVPAVLGTNRRRAAAFQAAWNERVSPGEAYYTGSPEGAGALAAQRGDDPFAVTTRMRTLWR